MKEQRYLKNVVTLKYDKEKCTGCGMCANVCPHGVFKLEEKRAAVTDRDACMECGACARNCPDNAITVRPGVGCAYAILLGKFSGTAPSCGCSGKSGTSCS